MSFAIQEINLEVTPSKQMPVVYATQHEKVGRLVRLHIMDNGEEFILPVNAKITLSGTKPNKMYFSYDSEQNPAVVSYEENVVSFTMQEDMTDVFGNVLCGVTIEADGETVGTLNFVSRIQQDPIAEGALKEIVSIESVTTIQEDDGTTVIVTMTNGTAEQFFVPNGQDGEKGDDGDDGTSGKSPYINSENNHWMAYDDENQQWVDTGVDAGGSGSGESGKDGHSPYIGQNGHWFVFNDSTQQWTDTNVTAQGTKGDKGDPGNNGTDGHSPYIGTNGNWYAWSTAQNQYVDTEVKAQGEDGDDYVLTQQDKEDIASLVDGLPAVTTADNGNMLRVTNGAWVKTAMGWVPTVNTQQNGKILKVVDGAWTASDAPTELPAVTSSDSGKFLRVSSTGTWEASTVPSAESEGY